MDYKEKVIRKIQSIIRLGIIVSNNTRHDVVVEYAGYVNTFDCRYLVGGYSKVGYDTVRLTPVGGISVRNNSDCYDQLKEIHKSLTALLAKESKESK